MKVLGIFGGHDAHGLTAQMLTTTLAAVGSNDTTEQINLLDFDIRPYQQGQPNPTLDKLVDKLKTSDVWVFASPTYYGHLSGIMKNFFDCIRGKLCYTKPNGDTLPREEFRGKHYLSLTSCFSSTINNLFTGMTDQTFKEIDRAMSVAGAIKVHEIVATGTWKHHQLADKKIALCQKWGAKLTVKARKDKNTLKRYLELFLMIAVMALVTMGIQLGLQNWLNLSDFWIRYASFVLIFFVLLACILHIVTFAVHQRH